MLIAPNNDEILYFLRFALYYCVAVKVTTKLSSFLSFAEKTNSAF